MAKKNDVIPIDRNITQLPMDEVMHNSFMPYAEYVILERALPRVEDGLKPVQRRILYTMMELGLSPDKPHRKSARIVGDTLGKYHPHGDSSVYEAMVRMAQDFNMREPLVDGHGNFGSIDGDSAAAMRYTEARVTPLALELLRDIEKDTVNFRLNFDDTMREPEILPGRYPNLLVNGATGIAVGLATNIPPHNLCEVIDGVIAQMDKPDITVAELLRYVKGPDFPTGGFMLCDESLEEIYTTGRGRISIRAKTNIETDKNGKPIIVVTQIPFMVNKAKMMEKILKLSEEKKQLFSGMTDILDESDRTGIRVAIYLKKGTNADKILNALYKYSDMQVAFGFNMVAIANGKPQLMGLKEINTWYINYQKEVVLRRTRFDLENAQKREHILAGLMIAVDHLDEIIKLIRSSKTPAEAKNRLVSEFALTQIQAQAILDLRLQRLTGLEILALRQEYEQVLKLIAELQSILNSEKKLVSLIKKELLEIKEKYGNQRRTRFLNAPSQPVVVEEAPAAEDVVVVVQRGGALKRIPVKIYQKMVKETEPAEMENVQMLLETQTDQRLQIFTSHGNMYTLECKSLPEGKLNTRGALLNSLISGLEKGEEIIKVFAFDKAEGKNLLFYSKYGMVKCTQAEEYLTKKSKVAACGVNEDDKIINVEIQQPQQDILLVTAMGMSIHFINDIPLMGRTAKGVKGIQLEKDDRVVLAAQITQEGEIVTITDRGYAKRSLVVDYEMQGRNGKGLKTFQFMKNYSNGYEIVAAFHVKEPYELLISQKNGDVTKVYTEEIFIDLRFSKGTPLITVLMDNVITNVYRMIIT
ncbi:MAG: DNA gyrase subunit A [Christensenellales bacterium]